MNSEITALGKEYIGNQAFERHNPDSAQTVPHECAVSVQN
jgi:hypothetical protein